MNQLDFTDLGWIDLSESKLEILVATLPSDTTYYVIRATEAGTSTLKDSESALTSLGFRIPESDRAVIPSARTGAGRRPKGRDPEAAHDDGRSKAALMLRMATVNFQGRLSRPPTIEELKSVFGSARPVPFDRARHYIDQRRHDAAYQALLSRLSDTLKAIPDLGDTSLGEGAVKAAVLSIVERTAGSLGQAEIVSLAMAKPCLLARKIDDWAPGDSPADALRKALVAQLGDDLGHPRETRLDGAAAPSP